jgi:hemerythrin
VTITWNDGLSVGVDWMGAEHRELLGSMDALIEAIEGNRGGEVIGETLKFLDAYVRSHFAKEGMEMMRLDYPEKGVHFVEHAKFISTVNDLKAQIASDGVSQYVLVQAKRGLLDWFVNHICETDKRFGAFVRQGA